MAGIPFDPVSLGVSLVPSLYKGIAGIIQGNDADKVKLRDTTPAAFKEALGLGRQAAAAGLPGEGQQLNRINAGTNDTLQAGARAGTSGNSILGLLSSADANRNRALADLGTRSDTYHQQQNQHLTGLLQQQAQYQKADLGEFDRNKAALNESSQRNIFSAVEGGSQVAAYALAKAKEEKTGKKPIVDASGLSPYGPDHTSRRYNQYGVPGYSGLSISGYE